MTPPPRVVAHESYFLFSLEVPQRVVARVRDDLRHRAVDVDLDDPLLRAAARRHGAQGLAATQCGVDAAIVLLGDEAFVNPRIVERSPEARLRCWTERCLALPPDVRVETLRDETLTVAATTATGVPFTTTLTGAAARQFSHEYDHARGVLIIDHAYDTVASTAFPAMARLEEPFHTERRRRAWDRA